MRKKKQTVKADHHVLAVVRTVEVTVESKRPITEGEALRIAERTELRLAEAVAKLNHPASLPNMPDLTIVARLRS